MTNPFILSGPHWSAAPPQYVLVGVWQSDPQLHERPGGFRTLAGERHRSLSFPSLWKSIIGIHVLIHVSPCLPGEMPEAQICTHLNRIKRFWILCLTPEEIKVLLNRYDARLRPLSSRTRRLIFSALEKSLLPPCVHFRKAQQLAWTWPIWFEMTKSVLFSVLVLVLLVYC